MKATGIVRRIDDLGRIVIPKEIRRSFRIKEGDPLEIYTDAASFPPLRRSMLKFCIRTAACLLQLWIMTMLLLLRASASERCLSDE